MEDTRKRDIEAAARTFSGMEPADKLLSNTVLKDPAKVELLFYAWAHDPNDKIVLGQKIEADGYNEVYKLLDISRTIRPQRVTSPFAWPALCCR